MYGATFTEVIWVKLLRGIEASGIIWRGRNQVQKMLLHLFIVAQ
jgi:hypothetical protein